MKSQFARIKNRARSVSARTLALVLCFVMLVVAVSAGTIINSSMSFKEYGEAGTAVAGAVKSISAVDGSDDISDTNDSKVNQDAAAVSQESDDADEVKPVRKKGDLAATGATYYLLFGDNNNNPSTWTKYVSSSSATFTVTASAVLGAGTTYFTKDHNYYVAISSSTSYTNMYSQGDGTSSVSGTSTSPFKEGDSQGYNIGSTKYHFARFQLSESSVSSITVSVAGGSNTTYSFSATSSTHSIAYNTPTNGAFNAAPTTGIAGSTVTVTVTPDTGYYCTGVTYQPSGESAADATNSSTNSYTFTMPNKNVTNVTATFAKKNYTITCPSRAQYTMTIQSSAQMGNTVSFTVSPAEGYVITGVSTTPSTSVTYSNGSGSFTMPASNVTVTVHYRSNSGIVTVYFKSATAYVYHPIISVNGGSEKEMTVDSTDPNGGYLNYNAKNGDTPYSDTGSLRYAWYSATFSGVDVSSPVKVRIRGIDTYMDASGTFTIENGVPIYLACDDLMEGSALVDVTNATNRDFYDTPRNMVE